jgi:hypothetical protein
MATSYDTLPSGDDQPVIVVHPQIDLLLPAPDPQDFSLASSRANIIKDVKMLLKARASSVRKIIVTPPPKDAKLPTPPAGATFLALANKLGVGVDILKPSEGPIMKVDYPAEYEQDFAAALSAWGADLKVTWTGRDGKELESTVRATMERPPRTSQPKGQAESTPAAERFAAVVSISGFPHDMLGSDSALAGLLAIFNISSEEYRVMAWGRMERDVPLPFNVVRVGLRRLTPELVGVTRMVAQGSTPIFFSWMKKSTCSKCGMWGHDPVLCPFRFVEDFEKAKSPQRWLYLDEDRYAPPPPPPTPRTHASKPNNPPVTEGQAQAHAQGAGTKSSKKTHNVPASAQADKSNTNNRFAVLASTVTPSSSAAQAATNKSRSGQRNSSNQPALTPTKPARDSTATIESPKNSSMRSAPTDGESASTAARRPEAHQASTTAAPQKLTNTTHPTPPERPTHDSPLRTPQPAHTVPASPKAVTLSQREVTDIWEKAFNEAELALKTSQYASPADCQTARIAYAKERSIELQEQARASKALKLAQRAPKKAATPPPPPLLQPQQPDRAPQATNQPRRSGSSTSH